MGHWKTKLLSATENKAATATLTVTSEDSAYPKANLQNLPVARTFRTTGISSQQLNFDLGSALPISLVALVNHNLSETATITVKAGATSGVADFEEAMTWRAEDAYLLLPEPETYRFWRIEIDDDSNTDGFLEIGLAMIGLAQQYAIGPRQNSPEFVDEYTNSEVESEYGAPHVDEVFHRVRIAFELDLDAAEDVVARAAFRALKRNVVPFFIIPDHSVYEGYFGRWVSDLSRSFTSIWESSWEFLQDGYGRSIGS